MWIRLSMVGVLVGGALLSGCATEGAARATFYGPQFRYYDQNEILDTMDRLADGVQVLDETLAGPRDATTQATVLSTLKKMEEAAAELALRGEAVSNHPLFDRYLDQLRDRLAEARVAAAGDPPDYFLVGTITGACLSCHERRRALNPGGAAFLENGSKVDVTGRRVVSSLLWRR